jgi:hypothetical protein
MARKFQPPRSKADRAYGRRLVKRWVLYLVGQDGINMQTFAHQRKIHNQGHDREDIDVRVAAIWILVPSKYCNFMNL